MFYKDIDFIKPIFPGKSHFIHILKLKDQDGDLQIDKRLAFKSDSINHVLQVLEELQNEIEMY